MFKQVVLSYMHFQIILNILGKFRKQFFFQSAIDPLEILCSVMGKFMICALSSILTMKHSFKRTTLEVQWSCISNTDFTGPTILVWFDY